MAKTSIPFAVRKELRCYLENCKGSIVYLGSKKGMRYYRYSYAEEQEAGFPVVVQFDGEYALQLPDLEALRIVGIFCH